MSVALRYWLQQAGAIEDPDAPVALHVCYARNFEPTPGRTNCIFTMFEQEPVPPWFVQAFKESDAIIVPCEYSREIFRPLTDRPIYKVPLGIDPRLFPYVDRVDPRASGRPFRFFFAGAHNRRKGWLELMRAWDEGGFRDRTDCELYVKVTDNLDGIGVRGNVTVDPRIVTDKEMLELYARAHCFVFPSYGEGWALTVEESLATGLPTIVPLHTGIAEFCDPTVVLPVKWQIVPLHLQAFDVNPGGRPDDLRKPWPARCQVPRVPHLIRRMRWVLEHWDEAKAMGQRAHMRAHEYTWARAGQELCRVLGLIAARAARRRPVVAA